MRKERGVEEWRGKKNERLRAESEVRASRALINRRRIRL